MERLIFEGRFLVNAVGGILRQDDLQIRYSRINWESMFRMADYHKIANIMYLVSLGNGDKIPERWLERFFDRYREALRFGDVCEESQKEVLMMLEMMKVSCIAFSFCFLRNLYPIPEMSSGNLLKLLFDQDSYMMAKGYLIDLGYETDRTYKGYGEHMRNAAGFDLEIYYKLPFYTKLYEKNIRYMLEMVHPWNQNYSYVRRMSADSQFAFMLAGAAYAYTIDRLLIRDVLNLYLFHKIWHEKLNEEAIWRRLRDFKIDGLAKKILHIAYMWFGNKKEILSDDGLTEDTSVYDVLENRILSRGTLNKEIDIQAIKLAVLIKRDIEKEQLSEKIAALLEKWKKKEQNIKRKLRWLFPEYKYMCAIYPILEKMPLLLPFCWIWRGGRHFKGLIARMIYNKNSK